jgi:NADH-quinone oxidoreductase subunit N
MGTNLAGIAPELALSGTILVLLIADLFLRAHPSRKVVSSILALAGIAAAAAGFALLPLDTPQTLFSGMIAVDGTAVFFKGLFLAAASLGVVFGAVSDEVPEGRAAEYQVMLLSLTLGMSLFAASRNLLMIYLSLELVSLPSYVLAGFRRGDKASSEAALKYVVFGAAASGMTLYGFSLLYGMAGTLDLAGIGNAVVARTAEAGIAGRLGLLVACLLSFAGFGYKVAAVPFHMWCPDVYQGAPTPFVAFLSVGPKAAGLAALMRFLYVGFGGGATSIGAFPWAEVLGIIAIATMTIGNLVAVHQDNVKRLLAYSSIAHAGYLLMGVAVGTAAATRAVMLYLPIYLLMNMGAFLAVQVVRDRSGSEDISAWRGLGSRSPVLAALMAIFLFSLTGVPPFAGFIGKFYVFAAVLETGRTFFYAVALVGVLNSVVSLFFYARIVRAMYLDKAADGAAPMPAGRGYAGLLALLAVPTLVLGVWWTPLADVVGALGGWVK